MVAIKQITEDAQMRSEQQLAFVREMSVLTQVCREGLGFQRWDGSGDGSWCLVAGYFTSQQLQVVGSFVVSSQGHRGPQPTAVHILVYIFIRFAYIMIYI